MYRLDGNGYCLEDILMDRTHPSNWKYTSSTEPGWHLVADPTNSPLTVLSVFRLNLEAGSSYTMKSDVLEMNLGVINGSIDVTIGDESQSLGKRGSFYLEAGDIAEIKAGDSGLVAYIAGARSQHLGKSFIRPFDPDQPVGNIHQIHGKGTYQREVFMTLAQEDHATAMINGFTQGNPGAWTSWPQHQHTKDLEEVYFYFDLPKPAFALQLLSREAGKVEFVHPVSEGDCVVVPEGYHPTVSMPGACSTYFWMMGAHSLPSRRYDLAINDPFFDVK